MEFLGVILFIFVIGCIGVGLQYWIVWRAVHDSDLAQDVKEIKEMLKKQLADSKQEEASEREGYSEQTAFSGLQLHDDCPGCGTRVLLTDQACKSCGLTLFNQDE